METWEWGGFLVTQGTGQELEQPESRRGTVGWVVKGLCDVCNLRPYSHLLETTGVFKAPKMMLSDCMSQMIKIIFVLSVSNIR